MRIEPFEALLHPARMRIVSALAGKPCTAAQIARAVPEIPTATLYRHLKVLVDAGIVNLNYQKHGRAAPAEGIYTYDDRAATFTAGDLGNVSGEMLRRYFSVFISSVLGDVDRYSHQPHINLETDLLQFNKVPVRLTRRRARTLLTEINRLLNSYAENPDDAGLVYFISHVAVPAAETEKDQ